MAMSYRIARDRQMNFFAKPLDNPWILDIFLLVAHIGLGHKDMARNCKEHDRFCFNTSSAESKRNPLAFRPAAMLQLYL